MAERVIQTGPQDKQVLDEFLGDAHSVGALHGSARGNRNVTGRIRAIGRLVDLSGDRLLDIGCGTGEYTTVLAKDFNEVAGIDIEPERLAVFEANKPSNVTVSAMSANTLNYDDHTFDVVTMIEVLEHLSDPVAALREVRRVLKPGGVFALTTPNRRWPLEQHGVLVGDKRYRSLTMPGLVWVKPLHRRFSDADAFTKRDLERLAAKTDMVLTGVTYMMPPLDSRGENSRAHGVLDKLETSPLSSFGQTIVGAFRASETIDLR